MHPSASVFAAIALVTTWNLSALAEGTHNHRASLRWALAASIASPANSAVLTEVRASLSGDLRSTETTFTLDPESARSSREFFVAELELDPTMTFARVTLVRVAPCAQPLVALSSQMSAWQAAQNLVSLPTLPRAESSRKQVPIDSMGRASFLMTLPGTQRKVRVNLALQSCGHGSTRSSSDCSDSAVDSLHALQREASDVDREVATRVSP